MTKKKAKRKVDATRWRFIEQQQAKILKAMQEILKSETWAKTVSDEKMNERIREMGVYTTPELTRRVRLKNKIGSCDQRRAELFESHASKPPKKSQ